MADTNQVALLNEELEQVRTQRSTLRAKHPGDTMPEEARIEDEALVTRGKRITDAIEVARQRERDAMFNEQAAYMEEPRFQISRAVNPDDEGRRVMMKAGWDVKNGMLTRPTSLRDKNGAHIEVAFCAEEVMFGPVPTADEPERAEYFRKTRRIMQPDYNGAFLRYIVLAGRLGGHNEAMMALKPEERNSLSEGRDDAGGFLVPPDFQTELLARLGQRAIMRQLCRVVPTNRDVLRWPALKAGTTSGSIYTSAFVGSWVGETPSQTNVDPVFQMFEIGIKKARAQTQLSNDFVADSAIGVMAMLANDGSNNLALVEDKGFIAGSGASNEPLGLINIPLASTLTSSSGLAIDVEGSTTDTISNTTSNAGTAPKILDLVYALPSQYAANASWAMTRASEGKTRKLLDANGRFLWTSYNDSGFAAGPHNIEGYPVYNSEWMPNDGTNANQVYAFGDFSNYIIAERAQISVRVLNERYADTDQTGIILSERVGGGCWNTDAFRFGIV